jgi:hypothetical protein
MRKILRIIAFPFILIISIAKAIFTNTVELYKEFEKK